MASENPFTAALEEAGIGSTEPNPFTAALETAGIGVEPNPFTQALAANPEPTFSSTTEKESFLSRILTALGNTPGVPELGMALRITDIPRQGLLGRAAGEEFPLGRAVATVMGETEPLRGQDVLERQLPELIESSPAAAAGFGTALEFADPTLALAGALKLSRTVSTLRGMGARGVAEGLVEGLPPLKSVPLAKEAQTAGKLVDPAVDSVIAATRPSATLAAQAEVNEQLAGPAAERGVAVAQRTANIRDQLYDMAVNRFERVTPEFIKRQVVDNYGLPAAYVDLKREGFGAIATAHDEALSAFHDLTEGLSGAQRRAVGSFIGKRLPEEELRRMTGIGDDLVSRAKGVRQMIDRNSLQLAETLTPGESRDTLLRNIGQYRSRLHLRHAVEDFQASDDVYDAAKNYLVANGTTKGGKALTESQAAKILQDMASGKPVETFSLGRNQPVRINHSILMRRKIPDEAGPLLDYMGMVTEAGLPEAKTLAAQGTMLAKSKFFRSVAGNEWALPDKLVDELRVAQRAQADEVVYQGVRYKQLPDTEALGALRGKYVQEFIHGDLTDFQAQLDDVAKFSAKLVNEFKVGKTVLSIKTHLRNMYGNGILLNLSGVRGDRIPTLLVRSAREILAGNELWDDHIRGIDVSQRLGGLGGKWFAARKLGLGVGSFTNAEINALIPKLEALEKAKGSFLGKLGRVYPWIKEKAGSAYQFEEVWFKMAKVLDEVDQGADLNTAINEANKWLFDYSNVSRFVQRMRRNPFLGSPFITFTAKAIPRIFESAIRHPVAFWKYPTLFSAVSYYAAQHQGFTERDYGQLLKQMPEYVSKGAFMLLPIKRSDGTVTLLDWTYIFPWGNFAEMVESFSGAVREPERLLAPVMGPLGGVVQMLTSGKDPFTRRPIWLEGDAASVKWRKATDFLIRYAMTPMLPELPGLTQGGHDWKRVSDAIRGQASRPDREPETMTQAIMSSILGLKTVSINPDQARRDLARRYAAEMKETEDAFRKATRQGDKKTAELNRAEYRRLADERDRKLSQLSEASQYQFKTWFRDFLRSGGFGRASEMTLGE